MIYNEVNRTYVNDATIRDGALIAASGIYLTNSGSGRIFGGLSFSQGGSTFANLPGGVVRLDADSGWDSLLITGSSGDDVVVNAGLIGGMVKLGDGNDTFIDRDGQAGSIDLGAGNDLYRLEGSNYRYLNVAGGSGRDRIVIANTGNHIDGGGLTGFEDAVFEKGGNLEHFSGLASITLSGSASFNFVESLNPSIDLALDGQWLRLFASTIHSLNGGAGNDAVALDGGSMVTGDIRLGAGRDSLSISADSVITGIADGGAGIDRLELLGEEGTEYSFDLSRISGFETVSVNAGYVTQLTERVSHLTGATQIDIGSNTTLILSESILPTANVSHGNLTLLAGSMIGRYGFPLDGFFNQNVDIRQGDGSQSMIVNDGTILGEVRLYIGDDLYDGRSGSVDGTVYGNAGNDTLLGGVGSERFEGGVGADRLEGNGGNDTLIGGGDADVLLGGLGSDTLTGGTGADIFLGTRAELTGDRITDLSVGDRINVTDAAYAGFSYTIHANGVLALGSGATIDIGRPNARLVLASNGAGTDMIAANHWSGLADFNGDGHSDILWRNSNGMVSDWLVAGNIRPDQVNPGAYNGSASVDWKIVETFDMDGDGLSDMLWRHVGGAVAVWRSTGTGFDGSGYNRPATVSTNWRIAGAGDLNGDGKDDILWQNTDGAISFWTSTGASFSENSYSHTSVGPSWHAIGLGDFNGDGAADIVWRNDDGSIAVWANNGNGTGFNEGAFHQSGVGPSWHIDGIGDLNGDGKDDLVWRNDNGALTTWLSNGNGFDQAKLEDNSVPASWQIAAVGDYNNDGKADILWRNDSGAVSIWDVNATATGYDKAVFNASVPNDWHVVAHEFML